MSELALPPLNTSPDAGVPPFPVMVDPPGINGTGLPFLFVHQPKNAGTSVRTALIEALLYRPGDVGGPTEESAYPRRQLCIPNRVYCWKGAPGERDDPGPLSVIAGHMQYRLTTQVP